MSIYRRKNRSKRSRFYTAEFRFRGRLHRQGGFADRDSAKMWLQTESLKLRREATGYVKPMLAAQVAPLIDKYIGKLEAQKRDEMYTYTAEKRLKRLASECGWITIGNMTWESLNDWVEAPQLHVHGKKRVQLQPRTKNQFVDLAVAFGKWLARAPQKLLPSSPFSDMGKLSAKPNESYRRAGTIEELNKLLAATNRRAEYLFRIYHSSIRRRTLRHLEFGWLHLDASPPFIKVPAEWDKSRREKKYVMRYEIAQELRAEKRRRRAKADDLVFPSIATVDDLREDLIKAGIAFEFGKNHRRLDFHALRRTLVRIGKGAGLSLEQVSALLGHKSITTTQKYYDEDVVAPELGESMERLPSIGKMRRGA